MHNPRGIDASGPTSLFYTFPGYKALKSTAVNTNWVR